MTDLERHTPVNPTLDALRRQYAHKAGLAELELFAAAANHLRLSIPAGEIALVPYGNVNNIQITLEGRRTIAQRTGRLKGIQGPEWCGPRQYDREGRKLPLEWEEVWTGEGLPYAARCFVTVDGWDHPANGTCRWEEFQQPSSPVWKKYSSHMLGNAAEKLALRRGFSAEIGKALADLADITGDYHLDPDDPDLAEEEPAVEHRLADAGRREGDAYRCSCGELFATLWAFNAHKKNPDPPPVPVRDRQPQCPEPLRLSLLERLEQLEMRNPALVDALRSQIAPAKIPNFRHAPNPQFTMAHGWLMSRLFADLEHQISDPAAPTSPGAPANTGREAAGSEPTPVHVYDDMPESTGRIDADQEPSYANPADDGRPFDD